MPFEQETFFPLRLGIAKFLMISVQKLINTVGVIHLVRTQNFPKN